MAFEAQQKTSSEQSDAKSQDSDHSELSVWALAWPTVLSNLLFSIVGVAGIGFVSPLGAEAVAAVTVGSQIFYGMQTVLLAISAGTTALVARNWGSKNTEEATKVVLASLWISLLFAIAISVPCFLVPELVVAPFGLDASTVEQAARMVVWISIFNIVFAVYFVMSAALRAAGDTKTPLRLAVITNIIHVSLLYPAIYGVSDILPAQGAAGVALAVGIAFSVSSIVVLGMWVKGALIIPFQWVKFIQRQRLFALYYVSYPAGMEQLVIRIGFFVFMAIISQVYGTVPFAAYGVGVQLLSLCFVVGFGFSIAGATLTGQYLGQKKPEEAAHSAKLALKYAVLSMSILGVAAILLAEPLARLLVADEAVVHYTVIFIYILGVAQPLMAVEFAIGGALRGAGDTRFPLKAVLAGLLVVRLGLSLLAIALGLDVVWVYAALLGDYLVKAIMLMARFKSRRWQNALPPQDAS